MSGNAATKLVKLLEHSALEEAADCLRTVAHPHRLRMIQLMVRGEHTVGELAAACEIPSHVASEHLMLMSRCGLLARDKRGRKVFYSVSEPHLEDILRCVETRFGPGRTGGSST